MILIFFLHTSKSRYNGERYDPLFRCGETEKDFLPKHPRHRRRLKVGFVQCSATADPENGACYFWNLMGDKALVRRHQICLELREGSSTIFRPPAMSPSPCYT